MSFIKSIKSVQKVLGEEGFYVSKHFNLVDDIGNEQKVEMLQQWKAVTKFKKGFFGGV